MHICLCRTYMHTLKMRMCVCVRARAFSFISQMNMQTHASMHNFLQDIRAHIHTDGSLTHTHTHTHTHSMQDELADRGASVALLPTVRSELDAAHDRGRRTEVPLSAPSPPPSLSKPETPETAHSAPCPGSFEYECTDHRHPHGLVLQVEVSWLGSRKPHSRENTVASLVPMRPLTGIRGVRGLRARFPMP